MLVHYKCPNCGADMNFDSASGHLSCGSCGHEEHIDTYDDVNISHSFEEEEAKEYQCENCGAIVITDKDTTATSCSFCGAGVVLADRLSGDLAPTKVIPFTISKEEAMQAFKKWCKNGRLTPKGFMTADRVKGITGMYVPFWMYDLDNDVEVKATGTKVRTYTRGDYRYRETHYYQVHRDLDVSYIKVPVDASEKMDDQLMDKLEPYNYGELKDFKTPYLAGYLAEKYNYTDQELFGRVKEKVAKFIDSYVASTISGYSSVTYDRKHIDTKQRNSYYVLLPVWMVYYDFDKQEHTFAMNGQTGKIVGKPPLSYGKAGAWFAGIAGGSFIIFKSIALMLGGGWL
ncbi:TFIIB-type zinc ribbon-containing protein [Gracilibacillus alcaliphilus]|uniref:TFIIB-type zinc ribbon-containing protein n=1 Tax=Gracilibacillus alcaliphilus TaxID=1401441 RepID=UPI00195B8FF8|nr:TFIIB-type zinc ribbon-containing protein [Gracilibacillus alcaliphilus]MBM7677131.1 DNA-directed RNA polymerase subunit RPC12/RpoP [Gracilibacillus alcaliphilus]